MAKTDLTKQNIPTPDTVVAPTQPLDSAYKGHYTNRHDNLVYELAEDASAVDGKTHKLRIPAQTNEAGNVTHPGLYWEGTKEEFKDVFEKV